MRLTPLPRLVILPFKRPVVEKSELPFRNDIDYPSRLITLWNLSPFFWMLAGNGGCIIVLKIPPPCSGLSLDVDTTISSIASLIRIRLQPRVITGGGPSVMVDGAFLPRFYTSYFPPISQRLFRGITEMVGHHWFRFFIF